MTLHIDTQDAIEEINETNNSATVNIEVIGSSVAIIAKKLINGNEIDPPFSAFDIGRIIVATSYQNTKVDVNVINNSDGIPTKTQPQPLAEAGNYQWNVINQPPDSYTATATFTHAESGVLMDSASTIFEVVPTINLRSLRVFVDEDVVEGGNIRPIYIRVLLAQVQQLKN